MISEEKLLGGAIPAFEVEHAAVRDEGLEPFLMMTGEPIDAEAAVTGSYTAQSVFIHVRLFRHIIDGREVIFHVLTTIVAADFVVPFTAEAGHAPAVRCHNDVVVSGHHLEIPTVGEELAHRGLRTTLTVEQSGIFLGGIEVRGQNHPHEHLLAVGGLHPTLHRLRRRNLVQNIFVDEAELLHRFVFQVDSVNL